MTAPAIHTPIIPMRHPRQPSLIPIWAEYLIDRANDRAWGGLHNQSITIELSARTFCLLAQGVDRTLIIHPVIGTEALTEIKQYILETAHARATTASQGHSNTITWSI